ncbi:MAG: hypothetical protein HQL99_10715 [Magnetococcales bacterium]|nr:hypothetical protein [Magnetococcales bacterium]
MKREAWRMEGVHERWEEFPQVRTVMPQGSGSGGTMAGCGCDFGNGGCVEDEPDCPRPPLSPLNLDTVLTVEDLRRLLKIVAYS